MDTNETVDPVSDTAAIREVFPRHPVKRLARLLSVPLGTAHEWTYRRLSNSRRRELARALLDEMDRQDVERSALRYRLAQWAAESGGLRVNWLFRWAAYLVAKLMQRRLRR